MTSRIARTIGVLLLVSRAPLGAQTPSPVNPHASPEARALLTYLYSISGHYILTGQHNFPNTIANWTDRAYDFTGRYPAVYGQDFGFQGGSDKDSIVARPALVEEAMRQYRNGAIVTFTWHAVRPTDDEPATFRDSVQGHLTDFEWHELLTPGTDLHKRWCAQVDVIAGYLKQLRDARVPILWRPYHEVNGNWFWWGGRKGQDGSAALYRQLFDRFVNFHHLDNLIWVWNANSPGSGNSGPGPYPDYFPGAAYADVLSVDVYGEFKQSYYDALVTLAENKPVALGEVGGVPSPAILQAQPKYAWFMTWSEFIEMGNSLDAVRAVYSDPHALSRDDPPMSQAMAAIRKASASPAPELVTPSPLPAARELLAKLYLTVGHGVLSGQDSESVQQVAELTNKIPAIYGADLASPNAQGVVAAAIREHRDHVTVSLTWRPERPTGGDSGKLSDFEWKELLTPGSRLFENWCIRVDGAAAALKQLQDADVPVLWRPYPQANGSKYWWAGHKAESAKLYRQLFDRLVNHHHLRNLVWVWSAAAGPYDDYFPGLAFADALSIDTGKTPYAWRRDNELARFAVGKVIGLGLDGWAPTAAMLDQPTQWAWFLSSGIETPDATRALYAHPQVISMVAPPVPAASRIGIFDGHGDVGTVLHPGSVEYDAGKQTYTVTGSGENMWFGSDAFQFVWKKVEGDVSLAADVTFLGTGKEGHRKGVLMIRQSLEADSPYADVARHGDGLTSLQARDEKGANTVEVQSAMKGPTRVRIAKRGDYFYIWVAGPGEELHFSGGSMRVPMSGPFYVGIGVCSHNKDVTEQAVFSNVELTLGSPKDAPKLYSTLEIVPVPGDRRVVYVAPGRITAPRWTTDGTAIVFNREGRVEQIPASGGQPQTIGGEDSPTKQSGRPAHLSPDGQQLAFLSFPDDQLEDKDVTLQVLSLKDGKVRPVAKLIGGKGSMDAPNWSPDSKRLAFVSYQWIQ